MFLNDRAKSRSHHPVDLQKLVDQRQKRNHHPDLTKLAGWKAMHLEADLPEGRMEEERQWALRMGLTGLDRCRQHRRQINSDLCAR